MKKKEIINLICPVCESKYVNARFLPCNYSVCSACIQSLTVDNVFKCKLCKHREHEVPVNGFPASTIINAQIAKEERILAFKNKKTQPVLTKRLRKEKEKIPESNPKSSKSNLTMGTHLHDVRV